VNVVDSLSDVLLDRPTPRAVLSSRASLTAARNEFESFQVVVEARQGLDGVGVAGGGPLRGPNGAEIPAGNLTLYREVGYRVGTAGKPPSDNEGGPGLWPDALIPATDYFYGERRSAFPIDLGAGEKMVAWVDVLVPADQPSGTYRGSVLVRDSSGPVGKLPLTVQVSDFSIPSTSSLRSAFLTDPGQICGVSFGSPNCNLDDPSTWKLRALFVRAGLENRISLPNGFPPPDSSTADELFARYAVPLIDGTDPSLRLRGAKLTTLDASSWCVNSTNGCLLTWKELAARYDFSSRIFAYLCDEPGDDLSIWQGCAATAARSEQVWPGLRRLVTASIEAAKADGGGWDGALGYTDLLTPVINDMIGASGSRRPSYDEYLDPARDRPGTARNELWLYTSCLSFSCSGAEDPPGTRSQFAGWPGYAIDEPASQARAMGWLSFEYGASGELYWNTAVSLSTAWTDQYVEGGNGDGNLFYPGRPDGGGGAVAIGGTHDIPIESIRLKRIRDGREDYEYLHLLAERGEGGEATNVVEKLFGSPATAARSATVGPGALEAARDELAGLIAG
jgi:glycosyl hydrolase family 123